MLNNPKRKLEDSKRNTRFEHSNGVKMGLNYAQHVKNNAFVFITHIYNI